MWKYWHILKNLKVNKIILYIYICFIFILFLQFWVVQIFKVDIKSKSNDYWNQQGSFHCPQEQYFSFAYKSITYFNVNIMPLGFLQRNSHFSYTFCSDTEEWYKSIFPSIKVIILEDTLLLSESQCCSYTFSYEHFFKKQKWNFLSKCPFIIKCTLEDSLVNIGEMLIMYFPYFFYPERNVS